MHRSPSTRALALGLITLFHVAMFEDVVMLVRMPPMPPPAAAPAAATEGHEHHGAHAASHSDPSNPDPAPNHDHGSCSNYCCSHGPADVGRLPTLQASYEAPAPGAASVDFVELHLSPTVSLNTLPNPPPVA